MHEASTNTKIDQREIVFFFQIDFVKFFAFRNVDENIQNFTVISFQISMKHPIVLEKNRSLEIFK